MLAAKATPTERRAWVFAALWVGSYFAARALLASGGLSPDWRVGLALIPVPLFLAFLWSWVRLVRAMDEMHRRIHLESLAIAFGLSALLLTTLALLQRAVTLSFEDWSYAHVWLYLPLFYFVSVGFVTRRYTGP